MNPLSSASSRSAALSPGPGVPALAIASLVLGILGLLTSVFLLGGLLALVGLTLGVVHLRRRPDARGMSWAGIGCSVLALVISGAILTLILNARQFARSGRGSSGTGFESWYGKPAPEVEFSTLDGEVVRMSDLKGRRVILDFWASWCRPCVQKVPHYLRLRREVSEEDLVIVGVTGEDPGVVRRFVEEQGINYLIACSSRGGLPAPYSEVKMLPTSFYIDRYGTIQHVSVGYRNYDSMLRHATDKDLPEPAEAAAP